MRVLVAAAVLSLLLACSSVSAEGVDSRCKVRSVRTSKMAVCQSIEEYEEYEYEQQLTTLNTCVRFTVDGGRMDPKFKAGDSSANYQGKFWCPTKADYNKNEGTGLDWGVCGPALPAVCFPPPTQAPTPYPTTPTTRAPTRFPTKPTTRKPTKKPTTGKPTRPTTRAPTLQPTQEPTTLAPTLNPATKRPTKPTKRPTRFPTRKPTRPPTLKPTKKPTTAFPTRPTTMAPTEEPTTPEPTTKEPTTNKPTKFPTKKSG